MTPVRVGHPIANFLRPHEFGAAQRDTAELRAVDPRASEPSRAARIDRPSTTGQWVELFTLVICIMIVAGAFVTLIRPELGDRPVTAEPLPEDGFPELRLLALPPYIAIGLLSLAHFRSVLRAALANAVHLILPGIVVLSLLWTIDFELSFRRVLAFLIPTLFAIYIAARYDERGVVRVLFASLLGCVLLSAAYVVVMPGVGIMQYDAAGAWRGAFTHKNVFGPVVLHMALFAVAARVHGIIGTRTLAALVIVACGMVVASRSVTSLMGFLALAYALPLFAIGRVDSKALAAYVLFTGAMAMAIVPFLSGIGEVMEMFGRDASLTGRLPMWGYVLAFISDRPILGYGYGAFWGVNNTPGEIIRGLVGWNPPHAHNAMLQALGDVGLVGASALVLSYSLSVIRACRRAARAASGTAVFPLMALWILFALSITEARLLEPNSLDWLLYLSVTASMLRPAASRIAEGAPGVMAAREAAGEARP